MDPGSSRSYPAWNQYSVLGMPLAVQLGLAPLSLPVIIGYVFPVHLAFTVHFIVTGPPYRRLRGVTSRSGAASGCSRVVMAATMFELSGPFIGWLGGPARR